MATQSDEHQQPDREVRLVLIGKTGNGKSSTGNTLLGANSTFDADCRASSATINCRMATGYFGSRKVLIVDTPGVLDTERTEEEIMNEIIKCVGMTSQGIHAFVFVVSIAARFTKEEHDAVKKFAERFGKDIYSHAMVVFTRFDEIRRKNKSIEDYLSLAPNTLKEFIQACGNRYVALENEALNDDTEKKKQLEEFYTIVDDMIKNNSGHCYTNEMLKAAEAYVQKQIEEEKQKILQEKKKKEEELQKEKERLVKEFEEKQKYLEDQQKEQERKLQEDREQKLKAKKEALEKYYENKMNEEKLRQDEREKIHKGEPGYIGYIWNGIKSVFGYN